MSQSFLILELNVVAGTSNTITSGDSIVEIVLDESSTVYGLRIEPRSPTDIISGFLLQYCPVCSDEEDEGSCFFVKSEDGKPKVKTSLVFNMHFNPFPTNIPHFLVWLSNFLFRALRRYRMHDKERANVCSNKVSIFVAWSHCASGQVFRKRKIIFKIFIIVFRTKLVTNIHCFQRHWIVSEQWRILLLPIWGITCDQFMH